jgi:hypothetical protein
MGLQVSFSFTTQAEKQEFEALAESRGLTLSQLARWCVFKYRMDRLAGAEASKAYRARRRGETKVLIKDSTEAQ